MNNWSTSVVLQHHFRLMILSFYVPSSSTRILLMAICWFGRSPWMERSLFRVAMIGCYGACLGTCLSLGIGFGGRLFRRMWGFFHGKLFTIPSLPWRFFLIVGSTPPLFAVSAPRGLSPNSIAWETVKRRDRRVWNESCSVPWPWVFLYNNDGWLGCLCPTRDNSFFASSTCGLSSGGNASLFLTTFLSHGNWSSIMQLQLRRCCGRA